MITLVRVSTYTHTVTFITNQILYSLKEIVREIGLHPGRMTQQWTSLERAVGSWLQSQHLQRVVLEVSDARRVKLVTRWDFDIIYDTFGDGAFRADPDEVRYHIRKAGHAPSDC